MKACYLIPVLLACLSLLRGHAATTDWEHNPYAYPYDMSLYVALSTIDGCPVERPDSFRLGAFCGDECRGIAEFKTVAGHSYFYLRARSHKAAGDTLTFRVCHLATGRTALATETVRFASTHTVGLPSEPLALHAVCSYRLVYMIGDAVFAEMQVAYGETILPPAVDPADHATFESWIDVPATMPAHDVTIRARLRPTGLTTPTAATDAVTVYGLDGSLLIRRADPGSLPAMLPRGVYLVNGRKVMHK